MTNEQAKQEAIKKAYGESYELCRPFIDKNGWCVVFKDCDEKFKGIAGNQTHFQENEIEGGQCTHSIHGKGISFKPKSLGDIEHNNGWIRIEPDESNLPDDETFRYKVCKGEIIHNSTYNLRETLELHKIYELTHYKPIEPELRPIY